jgi:hypothetical protein
MKIKNSSGTVSTVGAGVSATGWLTDSNTWTYSSVDGPTGIISVNADMTGSIGIGDRVKLTQTTVKYFIVTAVGAFSGGATLITVYGGTDYTLANAAISLTYYSHMKSPLGFPVDPAKWTVVLADTSNRAQASPTATTWYNLGSLSISLPIGCWHVEYQVTGHWQYTSAAIDHSLLVTLSTANNSESDTGFTYKRTLRQSSVAAFEYIVASRRKTLLLASKTAYYLNAKTDDTTSTIAFDNDLVPLTITARCAYL